MNFYCWYFGCELHPQDSSTFEYASCVRCGGSVSYENMVGITRCGGVKKWIGYWFFRRWCPEKCRDCGSRYGHHDDCLPF